MGEEAEVGENSTGCGWPPYVEPLEW